MKQSSAALLIVLLGHMLARCDSDDSNRRPSPTLSVTATASPAATATPNISVCPVDAATCAAALQVIDAWKRKDVDALIRLAAPLPTTCPVPRPTGLGGPYPLCDDATVDGEVREGYVWSSGSHGGITDVAGLRVRLEAAVVANQPLLTIGCELQRGSNICEGDFSLVFGRAASVNGIDQVTEMPVLRTGESRRLVGVLPVLLGSCEGARLEGSCELVQGGTGRGRLYRQWFDWTKSQPSPPNWTFFRWSP